MFAMFGMFGMFAMFAMFSIYICFVFHYESIVSFPISNLYWCIHERFCNVHNTMLYNLLRHSLEGHVPMYKCSFWSVSLNIQSHHHQTVRFYQMDREWSMFLRLLKIQRVDNGHYDLRYNSPSLLKRSLRFDVLPIQEMHSILQVMSWIRMFCRFEPE